MTTKTEAELGAEDGMNRAAEHADRETPDWQNMAYAMLERFARNNETFMTEDARAWATAQGLPRPPDQRAWGAVTVRGLNQKIIVGDGYRKTRLPPAHAAPRTVWRSTIYGRAA